MFLFYKKKALYRKNTRLGASLVELLLAIGLAGLVLPALLSGFVTSRQGRVQKDSRTQAIGMLSQVQEAVRSVRERGWTSFPANGTYYPVVTNGQWQLISGVATESGFTRSVTIESVYRNSSQEIVTSGGTLDPSSKKVTLSVSWTQPYISSVSATTYLTRYRDNASFVQTTQSDFNVNTLVNSSVTDAGGGAVQLANNTKAKWCSPEFSSATIDLPDGPPVAVAATASAVSTTIANDVFAITSPYATSSTKLAYITVPANIDPPTASLQGIFTMDESAYSSSSAFPSGTGLATDFITTAVEYYRSPSGNLYALIATTKPDKEVIAIQIKNGGNDSWQDATNKIYTYKTFFNTRRYQGNTSSQPNQDQSPYGYGGVSLEVSNNRGYLLSGGYLYVFDLSNIDSKSTASGLDMVGCRIEVDGYDCNPDTSRVTKYGSGATGTNFQSESAGQTGCMDGGAVQKYADNDVFVIRVGTSTYAYIAVGAGADPELSIVNVTNVPTSGTSPSISSNSCGRISGGNSSWRRIGTLDFNSSSGTQESANSVYGNSSGTRAYISSNGGVDGNGNGVPDSHQLYVVNTTNKSSPTFLSGSGSGPTSGYYSGDSTNIQTFPTRSLTVLNGQRVVLVGKDGFPSDGTQPKEYQVLNIDTESSPSYCGGLNFLSGFNDLTSVTEADFDNYVYMVANTQEKQLKIIQGGPDGTYIDTGTLESSTIDPGFSTAFNSYSANFSTPTNTSLRLQFAGADAVNGSCAGASFTYTGPDGTPDTYYTATSSAIALDSDGSGYENPARCFRYKAYFSTTDFNATAVLNDMTINYSP